MLIHPILLIGGSGVVGHWTARSLRAAYPDVPLLIGGRNLARAEQAAAELGNAKGVVVNLAADDLSLGVCPVSAVAVLFTDERVAALRFAQSRGVPHLSISRGINEIAPEVAAYIHDPDAAAIVLGTEWLVGATTVPTLEFVKAFSRVQDITIGALLDEQDAFGPAAQADLERQTKSMPVALARRNGTYYWRVGDDAKAKFRAVDGTEMEASALSPHDVVGLATATGAPNVQFNLALGVSSTRRRNEPMSTEIVIELAGEDHAGHPLRSRHAVVHPEGQMPLTGLGVAMVLERLLGLDGDPATPPGLYFPYQLLEPTAYFARLRQIGGVILRDTGEGVMREETYVSTSTVTATRSTKPVPIERRTNMDLIASVQDGDLVLAGELLRSGTNVNQCGREGHTPLMIASGLGQPRMVELLLTAGADVLAIEPRMGTTALHKAALSGSNEVIKLLLNYGAFIDQQSPLLGNTPLMDAVVYKHAEAVGLLLKHGARIMIRNHWQQTALDLARLDGLDAIAQLIEAQGETEARRIRSQTLTKAVKSNDVGEVERLVAIGISANERTPMTTSLDDDYTPLGLAAREGHTAIVRVLLDADADPNLVIGLMKGTPLHEAGYFGHANVVQALTERREHGGAPMLDLDTQGPYNGFTALHDAVWHGHFEAVRKLVQAGASLNLKTHAGLTPRELAVLYGYSDLAQFLAEAERG